MIFRCARPRIHLDLRSNIIASDTSCLIGYIQVHNHRVYISRHSRHLGHRDMFHVPLELHHFDQNTLCTITPDTDTDTQLHPWSFLQPYWLRENSWTDCVLLRLMFKLPSQHISLYSTSTWLELVLLIFKVWSFNSRGKNRCVQQHLPLIAWPSVMNCVNDADSPLWWSDRMYAGHTGMYPVDRENKNKVLIDDCHGRQWETFVASANQTSESSTPAPLETVKFFVKTWGSVVYWLDGSIRLIRIVDRVIWAYCHFANRVNIQEFERFYRVVSYVVMLIVDVKWDSRQRGSPCVYGTIVLVLELQHEFPDIQLRERSELE